MEHPKQHDDEAGGRLNTQHSEPRIEGLTARRSPRWVVHALIVFATVLAVVSGLNVWVDRQLLDTDEWVGASDELLANDEVRGLLAAFLVDELYESIDIAEQLDTRLPDNVDALAGLFAAALRDPATNGVNRLLGTDQVRGIWSDVNRTAHETLVRILRDDTGPALSTANGTVTLELRELVKQVGLEFGLSVDVVDKLPEDIGRVTIIESDELAAAQDVVRLIDALSVILFLLIVVLYGTAVYLAGRRRREAIREVGLALIVGSVVVLVGLRVSVGAVEGAVGDVSGAQGAARAAMVIGTDLLRSMALAGLAYGALIAGFAALAGPSNTASRLREKLVPVLLTKPAVAWFSASGAFLLLVYLVPSEPLQSWWRGLIFIALFAGAVVALRQQLAREFPDALLSPAPVVGEPTSSDAPG
jgi:hypothetical protein